MQPAQGQGVRPRRQARPVLEVLAAFGSPCRGRSAGSMRRRSGRSRNGAAKTPRRIALQPRPALCGATHTTVDACQRTLCFAPSSVQVVRAREPARAPAARMCAPGQRQVEQDAVVRARLARMLQLLPQQRHACASPSRFQERLKRARHLAVSQRMCWSRCRVLRAARCTLPLPQPMLASVRGSTTTCAPSDRA